MRDFRTLCTLGCLFSLAGVLVHFTALLLAEIPIPGLPRQEWLFVVSDVAFAMVLVGAATAIAGLIRLSVAGRVRQEPKCVWRACGGIFGPLFLLIVYAALFHFGR